VAWVIVARNPVGKLDHQAAPTRHFGEFGLEREAIFADGDDFR
jgi:hypothetical protein